MTPQRFSNGRDKEQHLQVPSDIAGSGGGGGGGGLTVVVPDEEFSPEPILQAWVSWASLTLSFLPPIPGKVTTTFSSSPLPIRSRILPTPHSGCLTRTPGCKKSTRGGASASASYRTDDTPRPSRCGAYDGVGVSTLCRSSGEISSRNRDGRLTLSPPYSRRCIAAVRKRRFLARVTPRYQRAGPSSSS